MTTPTPRNSSTPTAREQFAAEQARTLRERSKPTEYAPSGPDVPVQPSEAPDSQSELGGCL